MASDRVWQYAFGLVLDGAESTREDDLDEDGFFGDDSEAHEQAIDMAGKIIQTLRDNEDQIRFMMAAGL